MPISRNTIQLNDHRVKVIRSRSGKFNRLQAVVDSDGFDAGMPYCTITANVDRETLLDEDEYAIKDYAENFGILPQMIEQGMLLPHHKTLFSGLVIIFVCRLNPSFGWH